MSARAASSQLEAVERAQRLAERLRAPVAVSRSALAKLVATFRQEGDRKAFEALVRTVAAGRGGGRERGAGFSTQIDHASGVLLDFLAEEQALSDRELQGVLGWAERLIEVAEVLAPAARGGKGGAARPGRGASLRPRGRPSEAPSRTPKPSGKLGGLGGKNLQVLEGLRGGKTEGDGSKR
jgi:hypothetical protein